MTEVERERYREMAAEIRALLPMLKYPEILEELRAGGSLREARGVPRGGA
jgi:hypothetical protein